ncbi:MAG: hypothetical protein HF962_01280 [Sulfurovum sp.]|nr:hypothetical protein [Sulfurovum sp.]
MYLLNTPKEIIKDLAIRIEDERKVQKLSQKELSVKADIPLPTYKAFLYHQKLSVESLIKLLYALRMHDNIEGILTQRTHQTLADLKEDNLTKRVRK